MVLMITTLVTTLYCLSQKICNTFLEYLQKIAFVEHLQDSSVVILQALDIILSEIIPHLDLNEHEIFRPCIHNTVNGPHRNINGITCFKINLACTHYHERCSPHDIPMFGAAPVPLKA